MSCKCSIKFRVKSPEKIRIGFSVTGYKNRIVAPEIYTGETTVTAGEDDIVLQTHNKLVESDIRITGITGVKTITENGTYNTIGDKEVNVDVEPNLTSLSVTENGLYLPESGTDGFDRVNVDVPQPSGSTTIVENGTYNVEQYASAVVNVYPTAYSDDPKDFSGGNILALRSHAREWINTGYYPKEIVDISCCISKSAEETASQHGGILSAMFPSNRIGNQFVGTSIGRMYYYDGGYNMPVDGTISENPTQFFNRMGRISMPDGQFEVASKPLIIFYTYRGTGYDRLGAFTFYGLKCYEFFKLKKYYVPWLDENNVPCVHELVDDEYFYNVGTGAFGYIDLEGNVHDA